MSEELPRKNRYEALVENIFFEHYREGDTEFEFRKREFSTAATFL